ncbi:MAG: ATP-dependent protease [Gammaproteobacteria bacterium]|nr:MAG: ATP-dependent protease [Gammaproteobacteria bacterium]
MSKTGNQVAALTFDELPNCCDATQFEFETTNDLETLTDIIGQDRALEAIRFGLGMQSEGYNLYVLGPPGVGKYTAVNQYLQDLARRGPVPMDWCYGNNFKDASKPIRIELPPGRGVILREDMQHLVEDLKTAIPQAFDTDEYKARAQQIEMELQQKQENVFRGLHDSAKEKSVKLYQGAEGFSFIPMVNGEEINPETFENLTEAEQKQIEEANQELREQLREILQKSVPAWRKEAREKFMRVNHEVTMEAVGLYIETLSQKYADLPQMLNYLSAVQADIIANAADFRPAEAAPGGMPQIQQNSLSRYEINVMLDNSETTGMPVVFEDHPSYGNLLGRVENKAYMGMLSTDFTLIKPGALHKANGGYLVLEVRKLLMQPYAWEGLKQALYARELRIESLERALSLVSTISLEPEPIPLDVKVVLLGDRMLYYMLYAYDPDFAELFKVPADFEAQLDRNPENDFLYARMIATMVRNEKLVPFDKTAVAAVIRQSMRMVDDSEKLSTHMRSISDLLGEASYWATQAERSVATEEDVNKVIKTQVERVDRVRDRVQEGILREQVMIDTTGEVVGQVNGLSVLQMGNFSFGQPSRITATTRLGDGKLIDIARESDMGGPTHTKGVFTLSSFLGARYGQKAPLSLTASLAFEQSYGGVDGDSATMAELCVLLSSLSGLPIKQSFAITGSMNQHGRAQVIGGVNEKIEGFFDICNARELTSDQGVLIPAKNVVNLLLRPDVTNAIEQGQFSIYPISHVDEAISLLTGIPAGEADEQGQFPPDTINGRVQARLEQFAELRRNFGKDEKSEPEKVKVTVSEPTPEGPDIPDGPPANSH